MAEKEASAMRVCPLCQKPAALRECCPLGKIPGAEWEMEHMPIFLDILAREKHKWAKLGSLGDMVDASLGDGGYKEVFKKERLVGKQLFGKQRKTISDIMKRIGIKNVKHRDLLVESIYDLSKPLPPQSDEELMAAKFTLVRNTWSVERMPEIQLHAMSDVLGSSADEAQHQLLLKFDLLKLLKEVIDRDMMDPTREQDLKDRQKEVDELWKRRRKRELDYEQKKDLDRKEHLLARDWLQWKADFGSLAVAAFATLQNVSKSPVFTKDIAADSFPEMLILQLDRCRDAEKRLTLLRAMGKGQYMSLVASEVAEQQQMVLNIIYNLSMEPENRPVLCSRGIAEAVVTVAQSPTVKDTPRYNQCIRIFSNLSIGGGETEARMVRDGVLGPVVNAVREGLGEMRLYAISTVQNLAFVEENSEAIIAAGVLIPLTKILKDEQESPVKLKAIDTIRNLAAAHADLRFAKIVVDELIEIVRNGGEEERLRCLIALRSITRFEETLQICEEQGVMRQALALIEHEDTRMRTQAIGLLINVIGFCAVVPLDADEEDELSDSELLSDEEDGGYSPSSPVQHDGTRPANSEAHETSSDHAESNAPEPASGPEALHSAAGEEDRPLSSHWNVLEERDGELVGAQRPLRRTNKLLQMRISPFFRLLSERELELLSLGSTYFTVEKGEALVVQGDSCESIYVIVKGIMRVLIGAKGAGKWGMHRISRDKNNPRHGMSPTSQHARSPQSPSLGDSLSPTDDLHSPGATSQALASPGLDSPMAGGKKKHGDKEKKAGSNFRPGKDTKEVARLRPGDSANELSVMEGRKSSATLVCMSDESIVMDITPKMLAKVLLERDEFKDAITSGEAVMLSDLDKVRRIWKHPAMSDDVAEKSNLFRIESSERKAKVQRHLLAIGALEVFERNVVQESKLLTKTMFQIGLTLLIGSAETKDNPLLKVDEDIIGQLKSIIEHSRDGQDFFGHTYKCEIVLLCMRLLAMNDANKRKFVQSAMIPFILDLLKEDDPEVVRLATATLLELSFGMQARWLLRPILGIWNKYVKGAQVERDILAIPPPLTDAVDIAAPTHLVQVRALDAEPTFSHELHEAAYEGGQQWIERLVEEDGVAPDTKDQNGATALHFAALNARFEAMSYLMDHDVDINIHDGAGCTPLAWYVMAKNIEFGTDQEAWPDEQKKVVEWMASQGAVARFLPMFANTV